MGVDQDKEAEFIHRINESQGIIHKVCRMYCDNETHREDLFQEILIQLWKSYDSFRGDSKFSSWMYRVALNVAIQDFRKEKKRKLLFFTSYEIKDIKIENESKDERLRDLYTAINNLNKVERAIMLLYLEDISNEEIADIIGVSQNNVRVKMHRIRNKLSKILKSN